MEIKADREENKIQPHEISSELGRTLKDRWIEESVVMTINAMYKYYSAKDEDSEA